MNQRRCFVATTQMLRATIQIDSTIFAIVLTCDSVAVLPPGKLRCLLKKGPFQKEGIVFQPSFFRGYFCIFLLVFGGSKGTNSCKMLDEAKLFFRLVCVKMMMRCPLKSAPLRNPTSLQTLLLLTILGKGFHFHKHV